MITHVVLFKFKPETSPAEIQQLADGLGGLPEQIEEIREYRFGPDFIHSERSYDFCLVSGFDDLESMQRYQAHPEHLKVLAHVKEISSSVLAVDFTG